MKKVFLTVILIVLFVTMFTSCKSMEELIKGKVPDLNRAFTSEVIISYDGTEVKATITRYGTGLWSMVVSEPETMAGLTLNYNDESVVASMGELSFEIPLEKLESGAVFATLFRVFDNAAAMNEMSFTQTEDGVRFSGNVNGQDYQLLFDPAENTLKSISIPEAGIEVKILSTAL
ncbi:MAG: hypothetical protein FWG90_07995 [Oscillospiraceae bacterium]|nr:hypothetical protein [Oscillospiraceae bacterium]